MKPYRVYKAPVLRAVQQFLLSKAPSQTQLLPVVTLCCCSLLFYGVCLVCKRSEVQDVAVVCGWLSTNSSVSCTSAFACAAKQTRLHDTQFCIQFARANKLPCVLLDGTLQVTVSASYMVVPISHCEDVGGLY